MLGGIGVAGVLAYLLLYIVKITLPKMQDKFDATLQRQESMFEATLERLLVRHAERDKAIFDAFLQERREAKE